MKKFVPNPEQINMAEALFAAMAHESLVRPVVEQYEATILEEHRFKIAPKWVELGVQDQVILDRKRTYLLSADDSKADFAECFTARDAAKLKVDHPEQCPLLEAESLRISAENALLVTFSTIPGFEAFAKPLLSMELRQKAVDITLRLMAPFCGTAEHILDRLVNS